MTTEREEINSKNREKYYSFAEIRQRRKGINHKYYLSHKQNWLLYAKARRRKVQNQVKKQCGGMKI